MKFMRGEKLRMGIIRKQYFGISAVAMAVIQIMLDIEWEDAEKPEIWGSLRLDTYPNPA